MRVSQVLIGLTVFCWAAQQKDCRADAIICDPNDKVAVNIQQQDYKEEPVVMCGPNEQTPVNIQKQDCKEAPVIMCDPNEKIPVTVNVLIDDNTFEDLQQMGAYDLTLVPASDFFWTKSFPAKPDTQIILYDEADPLTLSFQEGLLVTYPQGCDNYVYAFCHMDGVDLKGEFPKEVNLYLNPALGKCKIEVVCTQCP